MLETHDNVVAMRLARARLVLINLDRRDHRRSSRLLLDFLDVRTEHAAGRLSSEDLLTALDAIEMEANARA